jgi:hypothetical protein
MKKLGVKSIFFYCLLLGFSKPLFAINDSIQKVKPQFNWQAYGDFFLAYDANNPAGESRQPFLFNHNRHAKVDLNLGFLKMGLQHENYRANLSVQTGTFINDNYASDHPILRHFQEANAGVAINKRKNLWLDAGIFASHIGFESAISAENLTLSRSLVAEQTPYYMTGIKLNYVPNKKWTINLALLNGWQRIRAIKGNTLPALGTQLVYTANKNFSANWSTFIGTTFPDSIRRMRYYQNYYFQWQLNPKVLIIGGFDVGIQQRNKNSTTYHTWFSPIFIAQYAFNERWKMAARAERYADMQNIMITPTNQIGFDCNGYSLNWDYAPNPYLLFRFETRYLRSTLNVFENKGSFQNSNLLALGSLVFRIKK